MSWVLIIIAAILLLDALRMRGRLSGLAKAPAALPDEERDGRYQLVRAEGAPVAPEQTAQAAAFAEAEQLDAVDLVPGIQSSRRAFGFAAVVDPRGFRQTRLATGRTSGHALLLSRTLAERAGMDAMPPTDLRGLSKAAVRAKIYAPTTTEFVVVPGLRAAPDKPSQYYAEVYNVLGGATPIVLAFQLALYALLALGVVLPGARLEGLIALAVFQLQPVLGTVGSPVRCPDAWLMVLARLPYDLYVWLRTVGSAGNMPAQPSVAEKRLEYAALLREAWPKLFEPRRETCPLCESRNLAVQLRTRDLLQQKPGRFTLERCDDCGHIFQNPRLSLAGLDFYYKDFYDGLGEDQAAWAFGAQTKVYRARASMVEQVVHPQNWLDIGCGHGHFSLVAKEVLPETEFDGLDLSESIDEAARRGWVSHGYRCLFPDKAGDLAGRYDVASMHHYLEHTRDPEAELDAAATVLRDGGYLLIEVPDPESKIKRLLGRYWVPWFQPQHQHLVSSRNLERLLRARGFTPLTWHRAEAHQQVDLTFAMLLFLRRIAPDPNQPWRPPSGLGARIWNRLVWAPGMVAVMMARGIDAMLGPIVRSIGWSNTYRVLARKDGAAHA